MLTWTLSERRASTADVLVDVEENTPATSTRRTAQESGLVARVVVVVELSGRAASPLLRGPEQKTSVSWRGDEVNLKNVRRVNGCDDRGTKDPFLGPRNSSQAVLAFPSSPPFFGEDDDVRCCDVEFFAGENVPLLSSFFFSLVHDVVDDKLHFVRQWSHNVLSLKETFLREHETLH